MVHDVELQVCERPQDPIRLLLVPPIADAASPAAVLLLLLLLLLPHAFLVIDPYFMVPYVYLLAALIGQ